MHSDTWAISPASSLSYYRAAAAIGGAGALTLLKSEAVFSGVGVKIVINSTGNDAGTTYTIVGQALGATATTTATQAGGNTGTGTVSSNYWQVINSITADKAATGDVNIGYNASWALPRTRIRGVHYVGNGSAGSLVVNLNATTGTQILKIDTPASATFAEYVNCGGGLVVGRSAALTDFGVITATNVALYTIFCS
jgi:sporulation-control protein spo0M